MSFLPFRDTHSIAYFADRHEAGEKLAQAVLYEVKQQPELETARFVVYALPKGGLPIAAPIAALLGCPLDVIVAKKITRPDNVELAIGAVTADGHVVWDAHRRGLSVLPSYIDPRTSVATFAPSNQYDEALYEALCHAQAQLAELSPDSPRFSPQGAIAILVDDGIATGMTIAAAVKAVRSQRPAQIWLCAPVAPLELMPLLQSYGDRVIVLATPHPFYSVSRFYKAFPQVSMAEAAAYLQY
ncbi:phosphoribosyltransferase [Stenomitos frigidus]|uniref:Phosphoribosyltransferase n=1 Tax=Stenomitos frigidus ULC18 TaxID=2107698 RepID=A0A2T1DX20_9CYAN|nr:phosphoribosyltransferase family protein [Stenomitos frigidus]PSB25063.1 phosphoribosyltransferase [Stenomitos frigidus ULC18]